MEIPKIFADILHIIAELVHWLVENIVVHVPQVVQRVLVSYRSEFVLMLIDVYSLCTSWNAGLQLVTAQLHVSSGPTIPSLRPDPNAPLRNHPLTQLYRVVDESVVEHQNFERDQVIKDLYLRTKDHAEKISQGVKRMRESPGVPHKHEWSKQRRYASST
jgi:hypothetical protein